MSSQYKVETATSTTTSTEVKIEATSFEDPHHTRHLYSTILEEYEQRILPVYNHITKAKSQMPPYWDDKTNSPSKMPLYQHNVSSGRFYQAMTQIALPYNSFFPNQSYSKSLIEVKIQNYPYTYSGEEGEPSPRELGAVDAFDKQKKLEQAFDNIIKNSPWAISEHLKLVSDYIHYGVGIYYFENPKTSYRYTTLDWRKVKFPSGTKANVDEWEYVFIEHEIPVNNLINKYKKAQLDWDKKALQELLTSIYNASNPVTNSLPNNDSSVSRLDEVRAGINPNTQYKVAAATINVVSCFYKDVDGSISCCMFVPSSNTSYTDLYLYKKKKVAKSFQSIFSVIVADPTEHEIRLVKGWGSKSYTLCHAYDRAFCRFLDHIDYASSLFLNMDPADMHKKIINFGSLNIGKFDSIQQLPSALKSIIEALLFIDSRIDYVTFTRGLNKNELHGGETPSGELANIMLMVEGRVHKHLLSRFLEQYSVHWSKVMSKILHICNKDTHLALNEDVKVKFKDYLLANNFTEEDLKLDDTSALNGDLPSNWTIVSRKPDGSGITGTVPHVVRALQPYLSSLPEDGFKFILGRIITDAFGDAEIMDKILPGSDLQKTSSEIDVQNAQVQAVILTNNRSEFDRDFDLVEDIDPQMTDDHKFVTFPASRDNDHLIYATVFLGKIEEAMQRMTKKEIGRTTLHIWMYNLVSSTQAHIELLRSDQIRGNRPEAQAIYEKFGQMFNLLRQVEAQANADRTKKIDALQTKMAQQAQDDPRRMEAMAKLELARAKQAEVQLKFDSNNFGKMLNTQKNRRAEENHVIDQRLKIKALLTPDVNPAQQGGAGRPRDTDQFRGLE